MQKAEAYAALSKAINQLAAVPYAELLALTETELPKSPIRLGHETVTIELKISAAGPEALRIDGTAYGPSCWRLERLEEHLIVRPNGKTLGLNEINN